MRLLHLGLCVNKYKLCFNEWQGIRQPEISSKLVRPIYTLDTGKVCVHVMCAKIFFTNFTFYVFIQPVLYGI